VLADIIKKPLEKEAFFIFITHPQAELVSASVQTLKQVQGDI